MNEAAPKTPVDPKPENTPSETAPPETAPRPKRGRWLFRVLLVLVVGLVVVIALLPTLLSLGPARSTLAGVVSGAIPGSLAADQVAIGWLKPAQVRGLVLRDAAGVEVLRVDEAKAEGASLIGLLQTRGRAVSVAVSGVSADVVVDEAGRINLLDALAEPKVESVVTPDGEPDRASSPSGGQPNATPTAPPAPSPSGSTQPAQLPARLSVLLDIQSVDVSVKTPQTPEPIRLRLDQATLDAQDLRSIVFKANGTVEDGGAASSSTGQLLVDATIEGLVDDQGVLDPIGTDIEADVLLENLPLSLAALAGQEVAMVKALVGADAATVSAHIGGHASDLVTTLSVTAGESLGATGSMRFDGQAFSLTQPGVLRWSVAPDALAAYSQWETDAPIVLEGELDAFRLPLVSSAPDLAQLEAKGALRVAEASTRVDGLGVVGVNDLAVRLTTEALGEDATLEVSGIPSVDDQPGSLALTAVLSQVLDPALRSIAIEGGLSEAPAASIADGLLSLDGLLAAAFGPTQTLSIDATAQAAPDQTLRVNGEVSGAGQGWRLDLAAGLEEGVLRLPALSASFVVHPELVDKLAERGWLGETPISLAGPATLTADLSGTVPLTPLSGSADASPPWANASLGGEVGLDQAAVGGIDALAGVTVRDLQLTVAPGPLDAPKAIAFKAALLHENKRGLIEAEALGIAMGSAGVPALQEATATLTGVPMALIEAVTNQSGQLRPWVGGSLEQLSIHLTPTRGALLLGQPAMAVSSGGARDGLEADASFVLRTPMVSGQGGFRVQQDVSATRIQADPDQPLALTARVRDAGLRSLRRTAEKGSLWQRFTLARDAEAQVKLSALDLVLPTGAGDQPVIAAELTAVVNDLHVKDLEDRVTKLTSVALSASTEDLNDSIQVQATARQSGVETPLLSVDGTLTGLALATSNSSESGVGTEAEPLSGVPGFTGSITGHRLPMNLADALAGTNQLLPRLFGDAIDTSWQGAWPGEADVRLTSNAIELVTQAGTQDYESISLPSGLSLKFDLLNLGDNALLGQLHPVFDMLRETALVELDEIEIALDQGTVLPIANASLAALDLSGGLNFGRIRMETGDDLVKLLVDYATKHQSNLKTEDLQKTLDLVNQGLALAGEDPIQFGGALQDPGKGRRSPNSRASITTIPFTLQDGVFETGQGWVDSRGVQIGFAGKTDLNTGEVDYKLGVPGNTLIGLSKDLFGKVLDPERIYEFQLGGNSQKQGQGLKLFGDGFDQFFRSGLMDQLQAQLGKGGGLDLTQFGVKEKDAEAIGGLLGGLLGGRQEPKADAPGTPTPQIDGTDASLGQPGTSVPWQTPD